MKRNRPLSLHAQDLIVAMAIRPQNWSYGYDLMKSTGLKSGTLYPILMRLAERGLLELQWQEAEQMGKPPRHAYRLTEMGLKVAHEAEVAKPARAKFKEQLA